MKIPPYPVVGVVLDHDPSSDGVVVAFPSLQMPGISVRRLYDGAADPLRINKKSLPPRGTKGLVLFPHGDFRNAVWLGSFNQNLRDAIPSDATDPFMEYTSHFSGDWNLLDQHGGYTRVFADGSSITANASGGAVPTVYRHIVDDKQQQQRVPFPQSDRNPKPPPPFTLSYNQAVSGSNGGASVTVSASGDVTVSCATSGHTATVNYNQTIWRIDGQGNVTVSLKQGAYFRISNGDLQVTGNVIAGYGGSDQVAVQTHTHGGVMTSTDNTAKPNAGT